MVKGPAWQRGPGDTASAPNRLPTPYLNAMSLKARITDDMKAAMRAKDADRLGAIRLLLAAIKQKEVDDRSELDDVAVVAVVGRLIKQRRDSIAAFTQAGRQDLADKELAELAVIEVYLPPQMDGSGIAAAVAAIIAEVGATGPGDTGKVMGLAKQRLGGQADMAAVSAAVRDALKR